MKHLRDGVILYYNFNNAFRYNLCNVDLCQTLTLIDFHGQIENASMPQSILVVVVTWHHHVHLISSQPLLGSFPLPEPGNSPRSGWEWRWSCEKIINSKPFQFMTDVLSKNKYCRLLLVCPYGWKLKWKQQTKMIKLWIFGVHVITAWLEHCRTLHQVHLHGRLLISTSWPFSTWSSSCLSLWVFCLEPPSVCLL